MTNGVDSIYSILNGHGIYEPKDLITDSEKDGAVG